MPRWWADELFFLTNENFRTRRMKLKSPKTKDIGLLREIADARRYASEHQDFRVWWLGQSGFLLQWRNRYVLFDPYLSDSLTQKYADTDKPHIRMTERVIDPRHLDFVDVVTSSHNHTDHLDAQTLRPLLNANPGMRLIIPEANRDFVCERLGCPRHFPVGLTDGEKVAVAGFEIHGIPAAHEELLRDEEGRCQYMGYLFRFGPWAVYHSGDTLIHEEIIQALAPFSIDLALLPINGHLPERRVAGNLNAEEAVELARRIKARMLIPCHYDMFTFNTADPQELVEAAEKAGQPYTILENGGSWDSSRLRK